MKNTKTVLLSLLLVLTALLFGCGRNEDRNPASSNDRSKKSTVLRAAGGIAAKSDLKKEQKEPPRPFLPPVAVSAEKRLLEYHVSITMRVTNLHSLRSGLLSVIPQYGFLTTSSWNGRQSRPSMSLSVKIRSDRLLPALQTITALGTLVSERINVTDHTEDMFVSTIRSARAALRTRRINPNAGTDAQRQDYRADEDSSDNEKIRKWRINDRIRWATVRVYAVGPEKAPAVRVPNLVRTLVDALNALLTFLVEILPALPLLLLGFWVWRKRRRIGAFLKKGDTPKNSGEG